MPTKEGTLLNPVTKCRENKRDIISNTAGEGDCTKKRDLASQSGSTTCKNTRSDKEDSDTEDKTKTTKGKQKGDNLLWISRA